MEKILKKYLAFDIGGTQVKFGVIDFNGNILKKGIFDTEGKLGVTNLLDRIFKIVDENISDISGITFSCSGQVNAKLGKIIGGTPIIDGWIGTNLKEIFEKKYFLPCAVENDVNCAALGELWLGAGKSEKDFLCLTIGTGVGGGIIINKKIYGGASGIAGEFGHFQLIKNGKECPCGKKGCYEQYASTTALVKNIFNKTGKNLNGKEIFEEAKKGNVDFLNEIDSWVDYIGDGLAVLTQIFNPKLIVIGGGVSAQKEYLLDKIKVNLSSKVQENYLKDLNLKIAECANDAGILGAVYHLIHY